MARAVSAFVPGQALEALGAAILDQDAVRRWIIGRLHPHGPRCPHCHAAAPEAQHAAWLAGGRLECPGCGRWHTAFSRTMLHGCKLEPRQIYLLALGLALGLGPKQTARAAGVSTETVRVWAGRFEQLASLMEPGR